MAPEGEILETASLFETPLRGSSPWGYRKIKRSKFPSASLPCSGNIVFSRPTWDQMEVDVPDLLPCGLAVIGSEVEAAHLGVVLHDLVSDDFRELEHRMEFFGCQVERIRDMTFRQNERVQAPNRMFVAYREGRSVFGNTFELRAVTEDAFPAPALTRSPSAP